MHSHKLRKSTSELGGTVLRDFSNNLHRGQTVKKPSHSQQLNLSQGAFFSAKIAVVLML